MDPHSPSWQDSLEYAEQTDVGLRRANNQDSKAVMLAASPAAWQQRGHLFMVADGMGAHAAGELASKLATDTVPLVYQKLSDLPAPEAIRSAVEEANAQIHSRGQASLDFRGMGTTCSVLVLAPQGAVVAHVGDSRVYRLRGGRYEQLTFDHSLVWEMRAQGQFRGDVPDYIPKNVITRSLGPNPTVQVDLEGPFPLVVGDTFLLCSDGLSGPVKDDEMGAILTCLSPAEAVRFLVHLACLRGGPDNITVIVARVAGEGLTAAREGNGDRVRLPNRSRPVHPLLWTLLAVFGVLGVGLLAVGAGQPHNALLWAALGSFIVAALAGVVAWFQASRPMDSLITTPGQQLGRAPYTATAATPHPDLVDRFRAIAEDLREATEKEGWSVDWQQFNGHAERAATAAKDGDATQAIREYCLAISFMMDELKKQNRD